MVELTFITKSEGLLDMACSNWSTRARVDLLSQPWNYEAKKICVTKRNSAWFPRIFPSSLLTIKKKTHFSSVGASWSRSNHNWCNWGRSARGWATRTRDWRKNLMNRDRPRTSHLHPSSSLPVRIRRLLRYALLAWKSSKKQKKEIEVLIAKGDGTRP